MGHRTRIGRGVESPSAVKVQAGGNWEPPETGDHQPPARRSPLEMQKPLHLGNTYVIKIEYHQIIIRQGEWNPGHHQLAVSLANPHVTTGGEGEGVMELCMVSDIEPTVWGCGGVGGRPRAWQREPGTGEGYRRHLVLPQHKATHNVRGPLLPAEVFSTSTDQTICESVTKIVMGLPLILCWGNDGSTSFSAQVSMMLSEKVAKHSMAVIPTV